ncbi:MAG: hypothetical protein ACXWQQ_09675 [Pseudobdellovibrio sp.]
MATKNKTILDAFASLRRAVSLIKTTAAQDLEFGHNQISVL